MFVENTSIHVNTNISAHIFWTIIQHFRRVDSFGHRPGGNDVIHDAFVQLTRHAVQPHEFSNTNENTNVERVERTRETNLLSIS